MFQFFDTLWAYISALWSFVLNMINVSIQFINIVLSAIALPLGLTHVLPPLIGVSITVVLSICIIKFLLGR